jgi:hypothetical protein
MENDSQTIQNNRYSCLDKMSVKKILIQNIQLVNQNVEPGKVCSSKYLSIVYTCYICFE